MIDGFRKIDFVYDEHYNCYICPENAVPKYSTTDRDGYRHYKSDPKKCSNCTSLSRCTGSIKNQRVITRHIWQDYLDISEDYRYTHQGKKDYKQRKETIERQFGSAKEYHGFRYTNMKGQQKMQMKAALTFTCLNMKKLAIMMDKMGRKHPNYDNLRRRKADYLLSVLQIIKIYQYNSNPRFKIWGLSTL